MDVLVQENLDYRENMFALKDPDYQGIDTYVQGEPPFDTTKLDNNIPLNWVPRDSWDYLELWALEAIC